MIFINYTRERKELCNVALEIYQSNLVVGTWGNVSIKIKDEDLILITPSGMDYRTMSVDDLVLLDLNANVIAGKWKPSVETPLHTGIYNSRSDLGGIVHVHSPYASAFAVARQNIPVILEETAQVIGHEIETVAYASCGSQDLADKTVKSLGKNKRAVLLANHGLVGAGKDINEALRICYIAEKTAMVTLQAKKLGQIYTLSNEEIEVLRQGFKNYGQTKE